MLTSYSSNAISAKARAIYGKRLTTANFHELLRLQSVSDVCGYLKTNTSYSKYLSGVNEATIHRGQLENLLNRSRIEKFFSLLNFDFNKGGGFFSYVIANLETTIILRALMLINSNSNEDLIARLPMFMQEHTTIDFNVLAKTKTFDDLLKVLEHTPYKNVLKPYNAQNGMINYKECEYALKTFYYKTVLEQIDKFYKGNTKKELTDLVKMEIELLNLSLIYRMRRYFNRSPEEVKRLLLPFNYRLNAHRIDELLACKDKPEYIQKIKLHTYNGSMRNVDFNYIEDYTKRLKYTINRKMMRFSTNAPIALYALMTLTQVEIENVIIIIEGIRYNTGSQVQNLLVLE